MRFLYFIFISILFLSCSSVPKKYLANDDICHYNDPIFKITKKDITLDIEEYQKKFDKKDTVLIDNKKFKNQFWSLSNGYITNKQTNKHK